MLGNSSKTLLFRAFLCALVSALMRDARSAEAAKRNSSILSSSPDAVRFLLFPHPERPFDFEEIRFNDPASLQSSSYDVSKPTKFIIHGFMSNGVNGTDGFPRDVKDAYLARNSDHSYNVINVDWEKLASPNASVFSALFYDSAVENVAVAGKRVGQFISWLQSQGKIDPTKTHLVGHSLGSHVSGWAGATVANMTGTVLGRISALDPAKPQFETDIEARRVRPFDANFVDVYHTSAGSAGLADVVGTVDFFVNGGTNQPGCVPVYGCSHSLAHAYFAQTILKDDPAQNSGDVSRCVCMTEEKFNQDKKCCDHRFLFGEFTRTGTAGKYYVKYLLDGQKKG